MAFEFSFKRHLTVQTVLIPCAHLCRYCSIASKGERQIARIGFERFFTLVNRFTAWSKVSGFSVGNVIHNSDDITDEVAAFLDDTIRDLHQTAPGPIIAKDTRIRMGIVRTGGARLRSDAAIRDWLSRWREAGALTVHGSFAGHGSAHDWWNNRAGDYAFLMRVQQIAVEMGFQVSQSIFVMKNTLPSLDRLLADLDRLPAKPVHRYVLPVAYMGRGRSRAAERHRITEEDRDHLQHLAADLDFTMAKWKSERERMAELATGAGKAPAQGLYLHVDERNIDVLEATSCEEIVRDLSERLQAAYRAVPSRSELMSRYGNPEGIKIYTMHEDLDRLWLDRCQEQRRLAFERGLTHFA